PALGGRRAGQRRRPVWRPPAGGTGGSVPAACPARQSHPPPAAPHARSPLSPTAAHRAPREPFDGSARPDESDVPGSGGPVGVSGAGRQSPGRSISHSVLAIARLAAESPCARGSPASPPAPLAARARQNLAPACGNRAGGGGGNGHRLA